MNKKLLATSVLALLVSMGANAQRFTDKLDRGLVAVKTTKGVYCSWRIQADEYYDVKYNLYRDGTRVNAEPLDVSNFTDASGSENSQYTVKAVLNGVELQASKAATVSVITIRKLSSSTISRSRLLMSLTMPAAPMWMAMARWKS